MKILADLEATTIDDPYIITAFQEIEYAVGYERDHGVSWWDLIRGKTGNGTATVRRLVLGAGTQAIQQLVCVDSCILYSPADIITQSGINVTSYYLPTVLIQSVGLTNELARLLAACNSVSYLLFSLIAIPNIERWGRRRLLIYAAAGQSFCYLIITVLIRYNEKPGYGGAPLPGLNVSYGQKQVASASIAFFFLYYVFFGIGMQGIPWLYRKLLFPDLDQCFAKRAAATEINSLGMRTKGAAIGTATNW